ncbi:TetR/AcrR family transcriptional regulator [Rhizobium calliandrae]|uniref:TetR/AcrR family transcriptional regulator n=1 Tax=Rhizobium calliandrae TaxID=1312182 RepID=A0ABT7KPL5_9HYPH|nr:TetR/AcrR family transcriptional regulator [Rhizobium calliandrae]MDL2410566.1 TetR/AcrR family transcriptional regulator [Rhizobium calliandrae]
MDASNRNSNEAGPKARHGGSREAIIKAAGRLFLERGFGFVSMDDLAKASDVARRTLYNQFATKEDIFREMLRRVSGQFEDALPPGIETHGDVEDVLRLVAGLILDAHKQPEYCGFLRMVVADSRQFPWIAEEFAAVMDPQTERLVQYLADQTARGVLDCQKPVLAAHQFMGMLNEMSLWPWMIGRESFPFADKDVIDETIRMFLLRYGRPQLAPPQRVHQTGAD